MAHRRIGQEVLRFSAKAGRPTSLDALGALIDWVPAGRALAGLYTAAKGEKAWPPLAMFKALLLAYDLSDVMLAEALADRASFRRFCGFASCEVTPERTAFVRFRRLLVAHGLDQSLFAAIARDLERKGATVRKGTLIDATVIGSASKGDQEAAWAKHKSRAPAHGYKAHIAADKDTEIIREVETTPANEADGAIALAGALKSYQGGLAIRERLAKSDPGNAGWQRDLALSFGKLALVHKQSGDKAKARDALRQGQAIMARLTKLSPDNATWKLAWFDGQIAELPERQDLSRTPPGTWPSPDTAGTKL
jgi:hypothetical protein